MPKSRHALLFLCAAALSAHAQSAPSLFPGGIVNAASYSATAPLVPGGIASAFGSFPLSAPLSAAGAPLPTNLGGLSLVFANGESAPLFYASAGEVNFQVPWDLAGQSQTTVTAMFASQSSTPQTVLLAAFAPGIFSLNSQGAGPGAILDSSYQVVNASNPAPAGAIIQIYSTGLGPVSNPPPSGSPGLSSPLSQSVSVPTLTIGGAPATVQYSGLAPTLVGVYQINAVVPAAATTGSAVPVTISMNGVVSNTVTMAVSAPAAPNPVPVITSLAPFSAAPGTGSLALLIAGSGFLPTSTVTFNGAAQTATYNSATQLALPLSAADLASAGSFAVTVSNPSPGGGASNTVEFVVQAGFSTGTASSIAWSNYGRDIRHTALSLTPSQPLDAIRWSTPVDLAPQYTNNELLIHYGSPLITQQNTVILPVKTGATGGFELQALNPANGTALWTLTSDYVLPPIDEWVPEFAPALTPSSRLYYPGAGGTVYYRDSPDAASGPQGQIAFYGLSTYQASQSVYNANVMIATPILSDSAGNIYFGFLALASTPAGLASGIARISASGQGTWISAATAAGDSSMVEVVRNCAPAIDENRGILYIAVSNGSAGYLLALNSTTLQPVAKARLYDPVSGLEATLDDNGTASPTIGPDGEVYYGVLENPEGENHYRGWLLHFTSELAQLKTPGAFGWDDTPSLVPSFMALSYKGASSYLLMIKYNDYATAGGTGENRIAIVDPDNTEIESITGATVMNEVLTILSPTPNASAPGVTEWCINSAAVDPATNSILAGNEDGKLYRWDLATNTFTQSVVLTPGIGEAYTPTLIGPDGTVYAINNATLFAVGQ